jgi:predicted CoA-substrate-specific enzyme activase
LNLFIIMKHTLRKSPKKYELFLGIDIGSVYIHFAVIDQDGLIIESKSVPHFGNIRIVLKTALNTLDFTEIRQIAFNKHAEDFFATGIHINQQIALIEGIRHLQKEAGSVFVIGGETFGLILFDQNHAYKKYIGNSSCAAGTGAFLDQQAVRLGLSSGAELGALAEKFKDEPPKIATRCAVFAKTDLIHCQQQGYSLEAIAAGLCKGLAHNIADTLLKGVSLREPLLAVGGVSKNRKVIQYLSEIVSYTIKVPDQPEIVSAVGCAVIARNKNILNKNVIFKPESLLLDQKAQKQFFFPPLLSKNSNYPNFYEHKRYFSHNVEIDVYQSIPKKHSIRVYLGIDIGSTSTKAVLISIDGKEQNILLGLYTRTLSQPIKATQALFKVLNELEKNHQIKFKFLGVGTTGSGRKFIQKIINADMAIDEITAHARAAYELNPKIDTIIEIGGQDSKFTILKNGLVTFSVMNYVCAAGTGSFIEEQANRLGVSLEEYSSEAINTTAPLTSDRCTVFMERDLNHLLSQDYSKNELLAAALHSVRDNYLSKVANMGKIGNVICFQGATAKNQALVLAFEQKLQKPIFVSKYCHLTGALGVCLILKRQNISSSRFRGIEFYRESLIVKEQICEDCKNHCKLKKIDIGGETILWGHLCGREDGIKNKRLTHQGFDLLSSRRKMFLSESLSPDISLVKDKLDRKKVDFETVIKKFKQIDFSNSLQKMKQIDLEETVDKFKESIGLNLLQLQHKYYVITREELQSKKEIHKISIGIPNALYLQEYVPFWNYFFRLLGCKIIISPLNKSFLKKGKKLTGAEFCAPISNWHGHIEYLRSRVDFLFLPHMFSDAPQDSDRFYCYYSNYAVSIVQNVELLHLEDRVISPVINFSEPSLENVRQIYESLPSRLKILQTPNHIHDAFINAWHWYSKQKQKLVELFIHQKDSIRDISVVLLGRPYIIFDPGMNKNIPQKFNQYGVPTFFQDMLPPVDELSNLAGKEYKKWNHWRYAAYILNAAEFCGQSHGLYPVFLTGFKCSPDSFALDYFKEIMDYYQKPYLILQVDEHDSDVGYDTRIEAAIRTFRSDFYEYRSIRKKKKTVKIDRSFPKGGYVLIPNYDSLSCSLISAAFKRQGYKSVLIEESPNTIQSSLRLNDGQCLPISAIVQGAIEIVKKHRLPVNNTAIFLNTICKLSCNFPQYPMMAQQLLKKEGGEFEKLHIFATEFEMTSLPYDLIYNVYIAYLLGGLLRRIVCKIRPYEVNPGETDKILEASRQKLYDCFQTKKSKEEAFEQIVDDFATVSLNTKFSSKPKVGIIGDLYIRDNDVFNQELIRELEQLGAEVITTPFSYVLRLLAVKSQSDLIKKGQYISMIRMKMMVEILEQFEKRFYSIAKKIIDEEFPSFDDTILSPLKEYNMSLKHGGETAQNIIKIYSMMHHYSDISLFIHVNPLFCCPGLVSESIFKHVEKKIGIPIISIIYDGTMNNKNDLLAPHLYYIQQSLNTEYTIKSKAAI